MSYLTRSILILFLLAGFLAASPQPVAACSCIPPRPPQVELTESEAVFAGKVVRIDIQERPIISSADPVRVIFEVSRVWKGPQEAGIAITTARDSASCGYDFIQGQEYLVYAYEDENGLATSLCSRTMSLASAAEDLEILGEGVVPPQIAEPEQPVLLYILAGSALGIGLILLAIVVLRKSSRRL